MNTTIIRRNAESLVAERTGQVVTLDKPTSPNQKFDRIVEINIQIINIQIVVKAA